MNPSSVTSRAPDTLPLQAHDPSAGGQAQRLPGSSRDAALHDQLYRYADDLQRMVERQGMLEAHYETLRESCARLTESRVMLEQLIGQSRDMHLVTDADGVILQCNPAAAPMAPMLHLVGSSLRQRVQASHQANFDSLREIALRGSSLGEEWELRLMREDPRAAPVIVSAQALVVNREADAPKLHWILRDVTHLREIQFESQIATMVFRNAAEAVMITDVEGEILAVNPAFTNITGYSPEDVTGRLPSILGSGMHDTAFYAELWRALREEGYWQGEIYNRRKNGEVYPEWLTVSAARDVDGRILSYISIFSDLSRILQTERRLAYLAHHDMLTDLPNRLLFQDRLSQMLAQARRSDTRFTLIFIDLDRFKQINDTLGHELGDRVLREAAKRLTSVVRDIDTVARLGGDEFVIIAPGLSGANSIATVCAKVIDALGTVMSIDGHELFIGGSLGVAEYPTHGNDDITLLKHADVAMYRAKAFGGNTHVIYDETVGDDDGALHMGNELRRAVERGQLRLEFQPQVAAAGRELLGVEALLRWDHPTFGSVPPAQFIPIAEQIGVILPIGHWVLETALRQLLIWDAAGLPKISMGVNISPRQLRHPDIVDDIRSVLDTSGLAPERLELEITESELMFHLDSDRAKLTALRELGVKIAIDDFGTGYSSLARLMQLPVDRLKLDRSFITELEHEGDPRARAISSAIVTMGRALGVGLVAEGVENSVQYELLWQQGCEVIQGYFTGRPMRPERLAEWIAGNPGVACPGNC